MANLVAPSPAGGVLEGWLQKKGEDLIPIWRQRWCVLSSRAADGSATLSYFADEAKRDQKGTIDLANTANVSCTKTDANYFEIRTPQRTYYMWATKDTECDMWVKHVQQALHAVNQFRQHGPPPPAAAAAAPTPATAPAYGAPPPATNPAAAATAPAAGAPPAYTEQAAPVSAMYPDLVGGYTPAYAPDAPQAQQQQQQPQPQAQQQPQLQQPAYAPQQQQQQQPAAAAAAPAASAPPAYALPAATAPGAAPAASAPPAAAVQQQQQQLPPQYGQQVAYAGPQSQPVVQQPGYAPGAPGAAAAAPAAAAAAGAAAAAAGGAAVASADQQQGLETNKVGALVYPQNMRYQIREKWFSLTGDQSVLDAWGRRIFFVKGEFFSIGNKISITDCHGHEHAYIKQKLRLGMPHHDIYRNGHVLCTVRQKFDLFKVSFEIDLHDHEAPTKDGHHQKVQLFVTGDYHGHNFNFTDAQRRWLCGVSQSWCQHGMVGVEVAAGWDNALLLAITVVIQKAVHDRQHHH